MGIKKKKPEGASYLHSHDFISAVYVLDTRYKISHGRIVSIRENE